MGGDSFPSIPSNDHFRIKAVDTVPVWLNDDGSHSYGLEYNPDHGPVVGWANIMTADICGEEYRLLHIYYQED